jgi:predicted phosphodiesterase
MKIYACSDLHVSPKHFSSKAKEFLREAADDQADWTLLCGDIYEGTREFTVKESIESPNGQELYELIKKLPQAIIIEGNHDLDLHKHLPPNVNFEIARFRRLSVDGKEFFVTHGWREYDLKLRRLAPIFKYIYRILPIVTKILPFWKTPSEMRAESLESPKKSTIYWAFVRGMSNQAMLHAIREGCIPIWGHSHRRHLDAYENWFSINCGDFDRDEFGDDVGGVIIEDGMVREWRSDRPAIRIP